MQEIRFHGRGGQGTVVASILMAKALFRAGQQVQSFPVFGVERRGAPVEAYLRVDREKILLRCNLYAPDTVVVLDARLMGTDAVLRGLKPEGSVLVNAPALPPEADAASLAGRRVCCVDATRIAVRHGLGTRTHPMANTAICGALARLLNTPPFEDLAAVIKQDLALKPNENVAAAREAFEAAAFEEKVAT
ncbi:MAG: 2-oxoacid:acceptor oxidoreductase family protein [Desulfobacterales bacterium]|jgi:pyruvate ferredoxin oxidoreductase gamma subunit/2-oxoisovalerate ferredoxin oxidoreductase gamma subunit